jgi:hypothetical protein
MASTPASLRHRCMSGSAGGGGTGGAWPEVPELPRYRPLWIAATTRRISQRGVKRTDPAITALRSPRP